VRTTKALAASLLALTTLGACGGFTSTEPDTTKAPASTLPATTTTTLSPAVLKAALLGPADVPGSKVSTSPPSKDDAANFNACFPGNPNDVSNEVSGPDLELTQRLVGRSYGSSVQTGTPGEAAAFVTTFASPAGAACVLAATKKSIADDPTPPKADGSSLTASTKAVAIADGGAVMTQKGNLVFDDKKVVAVEVELVTFRKGGVVVVVDVEAFMGPLVPGQGVALAQKIASRLP